MRILFVTNFYPPVSWGGIQLYTHGIARELKQRGHQVQVICAGDWDKGPRHLNRVTDDVYESVPVRRLHLDWAKASAPFRYLYDNPVTAVELTRLLAGFQPDVMHVTSCSTLSAGVIFTAKRADIPVIVTLADFWFICPRFTLLHADGHICDADVTPWHCTQCLAWGAKIYRWSRCILPEKTLASLLARAGKIDWLTRQRGLIGMIGDMAERQAYLRQALSESDVILSPSEYVKGAFAVQDMPADRIKPLTWGLPIGWTKPWQSPGPSEPVRIRYFGRVTPSKGVDVLLRAFRVVQGHALLFIHGSSTDAQGYQRELQQLASSDERITFAGAYKRDELGELLAQTDVAVVPSIWPETFCLVPREALMTGVPVVASRIGAIPDAVKHGENGLLFEAGDVQGLASALQRFLNEPELPQQLAQQIKPPKTISQECDELTDIYRALTCSPLPIGVPHPS